MQEERLTKEERKKVWPTNSILFIHQMYFIHFRPCLLSSANTGKRSHTGLGNVRLGFVLGIAIVEFLQRDIRGIVDFDVFGQVKVALRGSVVLAEPVFVCKLS